MIGGAGPDTGTSSAAESIDALEQRLIACERLIDRLRVVQVATLHQLEAAGVTTIDGARSMKDWITARLDLHPDTAGNVMRATRLLAQHPDLGAAVATGEVSTDRAVATATLRNSGASAEAIELSNGFDVAGVWRLAGRHRRHRRADEREASERRHLRLQPSLGGMIGTGWFELPAVDFTVLEKALFQRADELPRSPDAVREALGARLADALVSICQDSLDLEAPVTATTAPSVTVFVDAELAARTGGEAGSVTATIGLPVGPATLEELLCTGTVNVVGVDAGRPVTVTDGNRAIPPAIRDFVLNRDQGCTIDGCGSRYRLQPHHVIPWAGGGSHDADNLTTVCWYHHHVVIHTRGYTLDPESPPQRRRLVPPQFDDP